MTRAAVLVAAILASGTAWSDDPPRGTTGREASVGETAAAAGSAAALAWPEVARLFDDDPSVPMDLEERLIEEDDRIRVFDLTYASSRGGRVPAYLVEPKSGGRHAAILFGHWGFGTRTEFLPEARLYARAGAVCLLVDYPWVRPEPWRRPVDDLENPGPSRDAYAQAVVDLRRGLDLVLSRPGVDPNRVGYVGHSYGAQWGAILSAVESRIRAAVLLGGVGRSSDIWIDSDEPDLAALRKSLPDGLLDRYVETVSVLDAIRYVPHAAPTPLFFQFGRYERYFDETSMRRYFEAASEPKEVRWYGTGHELNDPRALADRAEWLRARIGIRRVRF